MTNRLLATALLALALTIPAQAREITHAMGVTEVPDAPVRIAILTNEGTEALLHLGVVPVGAAQSWEGDPFYPHLLERDLRERDDYSQPLKLLARGLAFDDPLTGEPRRFESELQLEW